MDKYKNFLDRYEYEIVRYLFKKKLSPRRIEDCIQVIQTVTIKESQTVIVEMMSVPLEAYMALCGLARVRNLQECIKNPSIEPVSYEYMIKLAICTLLDGLKLGSAVGEDMGKLAVTTVDEIKEKTLKQASRKATDSLYKPLREFKSRAAEAARREWKNGSKLLHHQLAKFLEEEYQDENGRHPFMFLPELENPKKESNTKKTPSKILREVCKKVAKEIQRPDLISGQKISS